MTYGGAGREHAPAVVATRSHEDRDAPARRYDHRALTAAAGLVAITLLAGSLAPAATATDPGPTPAPAPVKPKPVKKTRIGMSVEPSAKVVGVAYPLIVRFGVTVKRKGAVERRMVVTVDGKPAGGAWSWRDGSTVMYRPRRGFWPAKSTISVAADLHRTVLARDGKKREWIGSRNTTRTVTFRTARSFVAYVDGRTDTMVGEEERQEGQEAVHLAGQARLRHRSGIKVATDKYVTRRMTSQEAGITDETYDVTATYAVRITPTGEFIHGAPWARDGRFGRFNASHGCTNLTTNDAKWYYDRVMLGDPVVTTGTGRPMECDERARRPVERPVEGLAVQVRAQGRDRLTGPGPSAGDETGARAGGRLGERPVGAERLQHLHELVGRDRAGVEEPLREVAAEPAQLVRDLRLLDALGHRTMRNSWARSVTTLTSTSPPSVMSVTNERSIFSVVDGQVARAG